MHRRRHMQTERGVCAADTRAHRDTGTLAHMTAPLQSNLECAVCERERETEWSG
jgi:hypothetical protein